jgi:type IV secretion system protein VirB8
MSNASVLEEKNVSRLTPQVFTEAAKEFEKSKIEEVKFSRRVAWIVAGVSTTITVIALGSLYVGLFTHKDPEPVILKVESSTGVTTVLKSIKDVTDKYDEVVDRHWLANYIKARELYDWYTISEQFDAVKLMSSPNVGAEYAIKTQEKNAPLNTLKDKAKIVVKIISVSFLGDLAQVRYTTERQNTSGENLDGSPVQSWIATIAYQYEAGKMTDQQRLINPLGFKVISYRTDSEVVK